MLRVLRTNSLNAALDNLVLRLPYLRENPLMPLVLVVPTSGLGRWVQQALAWRQGVSANVKIEFAGSLIWSMARASMPNLPAQSPFAPAELRWQILAWLEKQTASAEPQCSVIHAFLQQASQRDLFEFSEQLAKQFDNYLAFREPWLQAWAKSKLLGLGVHEIWQAGLWRVLLGNLPELDVEHPLARFERSLIDFTSNPTPNSTPKRPNAQWPSALAVWGIEAMTPRYLRILTRLSTQLDVDMVQLLPSASYFSDVIAPHKPRNQLQLQLKQTAEAEHVLLARWGRSASEALDTFLNLQTQVENEETEQFIEPDKTSLLGSIQRSLFDAKVVDIPALDNTLQLHACHNLLRQLEVLQDVLLGCFEDYPDLKPDEVLVHCPDLNAVEALLPAAWHGQLPWRLVGRTGLGNSALDALLAWLDCALGQCLARDFLALADLQVFTQAWHLDSTRIDVWARWLNRSGAVGGFNPLEKTSLTQALDRLVLGFAMDPLSADQGAVLGAGRTVYALAGEVQGEGDQGLAALDDLYLQLSRMLHWRNRLSGRADAATWIDQLRELAEQLFMDSVSNQAFEYEQEYAALNATLATLRRQCTGFDVTFEILRAALELEAKQAPQGAAPTGQITFAPAGALRYVPARVSVWLQMEDQVFPQSISVVDWDLMASSPKPADPNPQIAQRAQFLDSVLATKDCFILLYNGRDERSDEERKCSVLIDDLRELIGKSWQPIFHPIHPFSPKASGIRRYSKDWYMIAQRATQLRDEDLPFGVEALQASSLWSENSTAPVPELDILLRSTQWQKKFLRFFQNPSREWLRHRLQLRDAWQEDLPELWHAYPRQAELRKLVGADIKSSSVKTQTQLTVSGYLDHPSLSDHELELEQVKWLAREHADFMLLAQRFPEFELDVVSAKPYPRDQLSFQLSHLLACASSHTERHRGLASISSGKIELSAAPVTMAKAQDQTKALLAVWKKGLEQPLAFFRAAALAQLKGSRDEQILKALKGSGDAEEQKEFGFCDMDDEHHALVWRDGLPDLEHLKQVWSQVLQHLPPLTEKKAQSDD